MSVVLEIPDQVAHAIRLPAVERQQSLMTDLRWRCMPEGY